MKTFRSFLLIALFALNSCAPGEAGVKKNPNGNNNNNNLDRCNCVDTDGDGICDFDEGRAENRDTDGDGIPDYLDLDSDGDGIPDAIEAGVNRPPCSPPVDSDNDGIPDFMDLDSDGNGIPDAIEVGDCDDWVLRGIPCDTDGNGIPDYADFDNDGDYIPDYIEIAGCEMWDLHRVPCDTDQDGIPDYMDIDSDGDGIGDRWEGSWDADGDGVPNFRDLDSDGDGIPDALEGCTGGDPLVEPCDCDGDGFYNFLDVDSDKDGLADGIEDANKNGVVDFGETDPCNPDTDGDGVSDLIEYMAGTDPLDPADNPRTRGDFVFLVPYEEDPDPPNDVLNFSTRFQHLDLLFVIDVSGSMSAEINAVRNGLAAMLQDVICTGNQNPAIDPCIPDVETGIIIFGQSGTAWTLRKEINNNNLISDPGPDNQSTEHLLPTTATGGNEQTVQAMRAGVQATCASDANRIGRACFRHRALHLIMLVTDEDLREDTQFSSRQNAWDDIYNIIDGRIIVNYGAGSTTEINNLINDMRAASSSGVPLVPVIESIAYNNIPVCQSMGANPFHQSGGEYRAIIRGDDAMAGPALSCAVQAVSSYMPQDVHALIFNDPTNVDARGNPVDAPSAFIESIEVYMVAADATCPAGYNTADGNGNGIHDMFMGILPGNPVCWRIHVKENIVVEPHVEPQVFKATIEVYGAGSAILDTREVFFLVPPELPVIIGPT